MIATVNNRLTPYFAGPERARLGGRELPWAALMERVNPAEKVAILAETTSPQMEQPVRRWSHSFTKDGLLQMFPQRLNQALGETQEVEKFLHAVVKWGLVLQGARVPHDWHEQKAKKLLEGLTPSGPNQLSVSMAELALQEEMLVYHAMNDMLRQVHASNLQYFFAALERLREREYVGRIEYLAPEVFRCFFYRRRVTDRVVATRSTAMATETDVDQVTFHAIHWHEVSNARPLAINDPQLNAPADVMELIRAIPRSLASQAYVAAGQEIFRRTVEREVTTERRTDVTLHTYYPDPALVIGDDYVVAGW